MLTLPKAGEWEWGPCSSSPSYFCHLLVSSLVSPTSSVTKPYCGFFEMMIMILSCYFDDYTALLLCYPNNLLFPVSGSKDPEVGGARGSLCMLPLEILKPGRTVIHRQTIGQWQRQDYRNAEVLTPAQVSFQVTPNFLGYCNLQTDPPLPTLASPCELVLVW